MNITKHFFFAGIYQKNNNLEFSIITTEAQGEISDIHHRMPVILKEEEIKIICTQKTQ